MSKPITKPTAAPGNTTTSQPSVHHLSIPSTSQHHQKEPSHPKLKTPRPEDVYDGKFGAGKFSDIILRPSHLKKVWASSNMKEELISIFQEHFKPKSSLEQEKVEYNEINIFSEFQLYNLVFAKNELIFDDYKASLLLHLSWNLLEFNPDQQTPTESEQNRINTTSTLGGAAQRSRTVHSQQQQQSTPQPDPDAEFAKLLTHKFTLFKNLLFEQLNEEEPALKFTSEELRRIADYMKESYFKHLRLYDYVLNNKQLCEVKRLTINVNEPIVAASLGDALLLGQEEALGYEDDVELVRADIRAQKDQITLDRKKREEADARRAQGLETEEDETLMDSELKGIQDERLRRAKIDKESKLIINGHTEKLDGTINQTMDERYKQLEEKVAIGASSMNISSRKR
ncbi:hypothetical protein FGO68_gene7054 [Halteria grandinella]|uniref:Uncharacterized protein n=1 Tax=Halteria grandinella TaxID=5974 RepID=A0A8J8T6W7_HALGN|nr:hypothetical protein FGO68_gene7054 [Halteria grandinella]